MLRKEVVVRRLLAPPPRGGRSLAPWEPERHDHRSTEAHQRRVLTDQLARHADGTVHPLVVRAADGRGLALIGVAPRHVRIAGRWQDHVLHQRLHEDAG